MGVLGLTPFLQKNYPHIIHRLPNRLKDLASRRLVIDGTLITQRLHYAPSPHPFRHVLGWYCLAQEMKQNGISAVCIFDGEKRSKAKEKELGRRQETRRLAASRGTLELSRTKRLDTLKSVVHSVRFLDDTGKSTIAEVLHRLNPRDGTGTVGTMDGLYRVGEQLRVLRQEVPPPELIQRDASVEASSRMDEELPNKGRVSFSRDDALLQEGGLTLEKDAVGESEKLVDRSQNLAYDLQLQPQDSTFVGLDAPDHATSKPLTAVEELKSTLLTSYRDFRSSISKVASLPLLESTPLNEQISSRPLSLVDESDDAREELVLTKTQCELTLEESKVWDELTFALTSATPTPLLNSAFSLDSSALRSAEDLLDTLKLKSEAIADSYQRRMATPTSRTYQESKDILEAMGVLCYEIEEEHEGEALASSLVLNGLADYVVSEDSDVLVYEAPIIRNFSNRSGPLSLIHGSDVRRALDLSKNAYIDFAVLLGTDFSRRIKNVGPSRAYNFIKEYGTIENILDSQAKYQPRSSPTEYLAQINSARRIFHSPPPISDRLALLVLSTEFGIVDETRVNVIMERCGLGKALMSSEFWDYETALSGNYFNDAPAMTASS